MRVSLRSLGLGMLLATAVSLGWAGSASAGHGDAPRVAVGQDGYGYVEMGWGCRVFFDARGNPTSHQGRCSDRQTHHAAGLWSANLRDRRPGHGWAWGHPGNHRAPRAVRGQDGYGYVEMGRGCRVFFDARGGQTSHQGHCSGSQLRHAGQAWGTSRHARRW